MAGKDPKDSSVTESTIASGTELRPKFPRGTFSPTLMTDSTFEKRSFFEVGRPDIDISIGL